MVQRAALFGIEGPDHTLKLPEEIDEHVTTVSALFSVLRCCPPADEFRERLSDLSRRLDRSPATVTIPTTSNRSGSETVLVSGFDVRAATAALVGRRSGIGQLAQIATAAFAGDLVPLARIVLEERTMPISAMGSVMDCASGASPERMHMVDLQAPRTLLGTLVDFPFPDWCRAWGVRMLPSEFRSPVRSGVPVLMVAGTLDGLTPIANARDVRRGLSHCTLVTVNNAGHDSLFDSPAVQRSIHEFLATGWTSDTTIDLPPLTFVGSETGPVKNNSR
jgi:pimeloyl-ACP methyl ester carboxylesterase